MHFTIEFVLDVTTDFDALLQRKPIVLRPKRHEFSIDRQCANQSKTNRAGRQGLLDQLMYVFFKFHLKKKGDLLSLPIVDQNVLQI